MPVVQANSSAEMCGEDPMPEEPKRSAPGLAFAHATSSRTVVAGTEGCT